MLTKRCYACSITKPFSSFSASKREKDGLQSQCKSCKSLYQRENKEAKARHDRTYGQTNKKSVAKRNAKYREQNKARVNFWAAKRRAAKLQASPRWLTEEHMADIALFYEEAFALRLYTGLLYHVDHIIPLQGKLVCGLHVPWNLRVLLAKDNQSKGNKYVDD